MRRRPVKLSRLLLLAPLALAACASHTVPAADSPAAAASARAASVQAVSAPQQNVPAEAFPPGPEEWSPAKTDGTAPKRECAGETQNGVLNASAPIAAAENLPADKAPEARIARDRHNQTLPAPAQDVPSFEGEETISLEGRRLSPLAYEPLLQDKPQNAPWKNETLKYGLYYSFIKAGTAYIKNRGLTDIGGRKAYVIQTTAFSAPVIDAFFKVRDVNYSWLDAENFYSLGYAQSVREGNYKRDEWLTFDYAQNLYYGEIQKKDAPRVISGPLPAGVLDMLTSLYFVRAQKLTAGTDVVFDIINREKQYPLVVKVLGKERVKTAAGTFDCVLVEPQFRGEGIFVSKGKSLKVWLTDDEYKMPVKMKTEVFIGSVSAELLEYKRN